MTEYIERKTALRIIDNYAKTVTDDGLVVVNAIKDIISVICPAAGVKPVKHGHWIRKLIYNKFASCIGSMMICSECNKDNKYDKRMDYCPNCGAKMDGKEVQE